MVICTTFGYKARIVLSGESGVGPFTKQCLRWMMSRSENEVLISIRNLEKRFGGRTPVTALQSFSLDIREGEFLSIVGPSGCGKTTLLRIIAGLETATEGEVELRAGSNEDIGFVFQDPNLMEWRTAVENAALVLELQGIEPEERRARAGEALRVAGLSGYEDFYPRDMSGGMRHRVAIARSLVHDPSVLVMDEPFAALDTFTRTEMGLELRRIWEKTGKTIIYVTHDVSEAVALSERVVVMSSQPGCVKEVVDVGLPRDRDEATRDSGSFVDLRSQIRNSIHAENTMAGRSESPPSAPVATRAASKVKALDKLKVWTQYAAVLVLLLALWKAITWAFRIPVILIPPPEQVLAEYISLARSSLWIHTWTTLQETLLGFLAGAALGFAAGYVIAKSRRAEQILMPYVVAAQTVPKVAFAPMIVIWFGFGMSSKVFLGMLIVFFPILINTILGMRSIGADQRELMASVKASRWQVFSKLEAFAMLPELFAGFKTGITLAVIGAVVGEFTGGRGGLGWLTNYAAGYADTPRVFAALVQLSLLGIGLYALVCLLERWLVPWRLGVTDDQ